MKFIAHQTGTVALSVSADDVMPAGGVMSRDVISVVKSRYEFSVAPIIPEGVPGFAIPSFTFQSGALVQENRTIPIFQLSIIPNGDIVSAPDTDTAEIVMDDFTNLLDTTLGYKFSQVQGRRVYQSTIVIEFEDGLESFIEPLVRIEKILDAEMPKGTTPFKIKKIGFGHGDPTQVIAPTLEAIENSDFLIERRAREPYSKNRYYSSAPTTTAEHLRILRKIEDAFRS
jgi:hypothetical protein